MQSASVYDWQIQYTSCTLACSRAADWQRFEAVDADMDRVGGEEGQVGAISTATALPLYGSCTHILPPQPESHTHSHSAETRWRRSHFRLMGNGVIIGRRAGRAHNGGHKTAVEKSQVVQSARLRGTL